MPAPNLTALQQRFNEVAALSCIEGQVKTLNVMVKSTATKTYQRARLARREIWQELALFAQGQVVALASEARPAGRKKPKVVPQQPSTSTAASDVEAAAG